MNKDDRGLDKDYAQFLSTLPWILSGPIALLELILLSKVCTRDTLKSIRYSSEWLLSIFTSYVHCACIGKLLKEESIK